MKKIIIATSIVFFVISTGTFLSCTKGVESRISKAEKRITGKWNLTKHTYKSYDSLGNVLVTHTSGAGYKGTLEFLNTAATVGTFNKVLATDSAKETIFAKYFAQKNCGDIATISDKSHLFYWDADPNDKRIFFWCIYGGGSLSRSANISDDANPTLTFNFETINNGYEEYVYYLNKI